MINDKEKVLWDAVNVTTPVMPSSRQALRQTSGTVRGYVRNSLKVKRLYALTETERCLVFNSKAQLAVLVRPMNKQRTQ